MATHSSILAWRIPRTEEPGGLQSVRLQRVELERVTNSLSFTPTLMDRPPHIVSNEESRI